MRIPSHALLLPISLAAGPVLAQTFTNVTAESGISASQQPLYADSYLAGGAVGDFNNDGFQDIFFPSGGGAPDRLYINNADGTFTDHADDAGVALSHRSTAAAVADFNNDGRLDIYVTSLGSAGSSAPGAHRLYRNDGNNIGGVPQFTDVAASVGVNSSGPLVDGYGGAWGDYDLDGDLDLAVAGWNSAENNRLFRNNADGTFTDVTTSAGLGNLFISMVGFAPRFADMDGDRYPELIWIGDFGTSLYFRNNADGTFTDITAATGTSLDFTEMGMTVADFNRDGLFDFYVTTISTNNLYMNNGAHSYTNRAGVAGCENTGWGWGAVAVDLDHDTLNDLVAVTQSGRQWVFRCAGISAGTPFFNDVTTESGFVSAVSGRGLSNLDIDNDGDQDLVIFPRSGPLTVFRNDLDTDAGDANWVRVMLDNAGDPGAAPNGVGSVIRVSVGDETQMGRIDAGSNYLSQSELSAHFGLGDADIIDELRVEWATGQVSVLTGVSVNQTVTVSLPASGCSPADNAEPFGTLDFSDVIGFLSAFGAGESAADLAPPTGVFDFSDVVAFLSAFGAGCP